MKMDNKLKAFAISLLRKGTFKWKPRGEAKKKYKVQVGEFKTGRAKFGYRCAMCEGIFKSGEVKMDHVDPVVDPKEGWQGFDVYIERMYCEEDNYQCLCPSCHDEKTAIETAERKRYRDLKKKLGKDNEL